MADDFDGEDGEIWDASDLLGDKPDINDWLDLGSDDAGLYEDAWDHAPINDFTDGQMEAFVEMLLDMPEEDWDEMLELWDDGGFWDWWDENYGTQ